jgi:hypothetical protein
MELVLVDLAVGEPAGECALGILALERSMVVILR